MEMRRPEVRYVFSGIWLGMSIAEVMYHCLADH
jgi:hypothetical protein